MPMDALTPNMRCSENKDEVNGGGEDVDQATKYVFSVGKKRSPVAAYENITKRVVCRVSRCQRSLTRARAVCFIYCCNYFQGIVWVPRREPKKVVRTNV